MYKYTLQRIRLNKVIKKYKLNCDESYILGRSEEKAQIVIKEDTISRAHLKIVISKNGSVSF